MSEPEPFDNLHVDQCRRCRGMFFRGDMVAAGKVKKKFGLPPTGRERGWYCRECAFIISGASEQLSLELPGPGT